MGLFDFHLVSIALLSMESWKPESSLSSYVICLNAKNHHQNTIIVSRKTEHFLAPNTPNSSN